jgi:hypothetical protein
MVSLKNISKEDFKQCKKALGLTAFYTLVLAAVYCYFACVKNAYLWVRIVIPAVIILGGIVVGMFVLCDNAKKRLKENNENEDLIN